jgi:hypothetical protein
VHCAWGFSDPESSVRTINLTQSHKDDHVAELFAVDEEDR